MAFFIYKTYPIMKIATLKILLLLFICVTACQKKESDKENKTNDTKAEKTIALKSLSDVITENKELSRFTTLLHASNTMYLLNGKENYTVFIPTDTAIDSSNLYTALLRKKNKHIIENHIFKGGISENNVMANDVAALSGKTIEITYKNNILHINDIPVKSKEIKASNGSLFVIDKVIQ
jgi:uncharacterized surface protein with fasciclin (FAS1) repeats